MLTTSDSSDQLDMSAVVPIDASESRTMPDTRSYSFTRENKGHWVVVILSLLVQTIFIHG
jgi:hypothetical protein